MAMPPDLDQVRRELQTAGRYMIERDLTWGNAGNISGRLAEGCLITATGTRLGELEEADLIACPLQSDGSEKYPRKPSKELGMHQAVYRMRPEVNYVLHASPFYATLVSATDVDLPGDWFVEDMYYLERVARVPYHHAGSSGLAQAVEVQAKAANILIMENHGVLVYDMSAREALMGLHTLEVVCHMVVAARAAGLPMKPLPSVTVNDFLEHAGYKPRRGWPS